ncbi:MAG: UrcA family protein [Pseudomonadales bacterium]|nr:UrcA family protein [Pseudomonadales bacterium]NIX07953.1 UrcA family protein [Pseudomonadales bacterium]
MSRTLFAAIALVIAGAASAESNEYRFAYNSTDFADVDSVKALYARIDKAARDYCPGYLPTRNLSEMSRCRAEVAADIVASIDNAALTALSKGEEDQVRVALENSDPTRDRS